MPTQIASELTGLSTDKLREWTSRRALIPADVRPKKKGSPAKFSWQTILVLRIAVLLRERFHVELQAHKTSFINLRANLRKRSFITLWGHRIAMTPDQWIIVDEDASIAFGDALLIRLDPHLHVLRDGFALPDVTTGRGQLDLFSLPNLHRADGSKALTKAVDSGRRRSA
ncbi:hypothetical protein FHS78_002375 [Parvibaculum indicum]|uniref:hypothetical protein n=1 Tax=Parvibaculum indicum TaxID=562969 RepID=UPI001962B1AB|nr:hypothetical protein [Parvibaculum indicum]NIJ42082.1 hypothetical protein [Parvibaculum indicum]